MTREALELFWETADQAEIVAWTMTADGRFLRTSRAALELAGLTFEQLVARGERERLWPVHPDERARFAELVRGCALKGLAGVCEPRFITRGGVYRWMRVRAVPVAFVDEASRCCLMTAVDVHDSRMAGDEQPTASVRETQVSASLEALLEHAPVGVAFMGPDLRFVRVNGEVARMTGLAPAEHAGRTAAEMLPHGSALPFERAREVVRTGVPVIGAEIEGTSADDPGQTHHWLASYYPIKAPDGEVTGAAAVLTDVTSRKRAESEARRLAAIVESSDDAIIGFALDGTIESWNRGAQRLFGWTAAEAIGRHFRMLRPPELSDDPEREESAATLMEQLVRGESVEQFESLDVAKDGRRIPVLFSASPLFDGAGRVSGAAAIIHDISARKRAEAEAYRLAAIVESSHEAIIGFALDGTIESWNRGANRLFGWTAADAIGTHLLRLLRPPELAADVQREEGRAKLMARLASGEPVEQAEGIALAKDGRRIPVWFSAFPLFDADGRVTGAAAMTHDISARKRAEAEAYRLAAIVESSHDAIIGFALDGTIESWNQGAHRLLGWTAAEAIGSSYQILRPHEFDHDPEHEESRAPLMARLSRGGPAEVFEGVAQAKDGRRIPVAVSVSPVVDALGRTTASAAIMHDISDQKRAQDELQASERRYRVLLESVPAKISVADPSFKGAYWNEAWLEYLGCSAEELQATALAQLIHPDDLAELDRAMLGGAAQRTSFECEGRVRRQDGAFLWHLVRVVPLDSPDGGEPSWLTTAMEIESIKQAELTLQETLRARGEFLEMVSHELRTPLTEILGDADVLYRRRGQLAGEVIDELSGGLLAAARRLKRPVDNMMVLSRLERGMALETEPVLLSRVIAETVKEFRERFRGVDVRLIVVEPQPIANANATSIDQVVFNLLANAATYGQGADVEVRIQAADGEVECLVLDRGPGLAADELAQVFEPAFRSRAVQRDVPGLGLGLSACRRLVEALGGSMWVSAREGGGIEAGFRLQALDDVLED